MKVFIGSSKEACEDLRDVASWIEEVGLEPLPWDEPTLFLPGENTLMKLIEIANKLMLPSSSSAKTTGYGIGWMD